MLSVRREGVRRQHGDTVVYSEPRTTSRASVLPTWANVGLGLRGPRPARWTTSNVNWACAQGGHHEPPPLIGRVGLVVAPAAERDLLVQIEVGAPLAIG